MLITYQEKCRYLNIIYQILIMSHYNPIFYDQTGNSGIIATGNLTITPNEQTHARSQTFTKKQLYQNKFFDKDAFNEGKNPISLDNPEPFCVKAPVFGKDIYAQTYISYINVDSSKRQRQPTNIYENQLYNLPPYALSFTNRSSIITVSFPNHPFEIDDRIILGNIISKNIMLHNVLMVKKNSFYMKVHQKNHGLSFYDLYDSTNPDEFLPIEFVDDLPASYNPDDIIQDKTTQYYILKKNNIIDSNVQQSSRRNLFQIPEAQFSGIKGSDFSRTRIGNIPINYLNQKHQILLIFTREDNGFVQDPDHYLIQLQRRSSINYKDGVNYITNINGEPTQIISNNTISVKFFDLYGIPLNYLNSGLPISETRHYPYFTILDVSDDSFTFDVGINAIVNPRSNFFSVNDLIGHDFDALEIINSNRGGGLDSYVRRVAETTIANPNPSNYTFVLDKSYKNVIQARLIGSAFPNSQRIINDNPSDIINNRLYWTNLDDGNWIYYLEVTPGNYSPNKLAKEIEKQFNNTLRFQYSTDFQQGVIPEIISQSIPTNDSFYDDGGFSKYHFVEVNISETTDIVTFAQFRERRMQNNLDDIDPVLFIPDDFIDFTMAENVAINFGACLLCNVEGRLVPSESLEELEKKHLINDDKTCGIPGGTGIVPQNIMPFNPQCEYLYIYFTENSHQRINQSFPFAYNNLYKFLDYVPPDTSNTNGTNTFRTELNTITALLVNFYRNKGIYPNTESVQELNSVNTSTLLENFNYNNLTGEVFMPNHRLHQGDLIITDQFYNPVSPNQIFIYEITKIISLEKFATRRINQGEEIKFIYDSLIINFNKDPINPTDAYYWLDQITASEPIGPPQNPKSPQNNNTLSFTQISPLASNKRVLRVGYPNHQLRAGDEIRITNSGTINQVPPNAINRKHIIARIIDDDHYEIILELYTPIPLAKSINQSNAISIFYPESFRMFFNFNDTLGNLLSFQKVGQPIAITPYNFVIKNTNPYSIDYNFNSLGTEFDQPLKKLDMTGNDYFYISIPQLGYYRNTDPVQDVFAKLYWTENPGNIAFNSFVPSTGTYDPPISELSIINVSILHPNGKPVEFNQLNHSFDIEIVETANQPIGTDISARTNSETIIRKAQSGRNQSQCFSPSGQSPYG